MQVNSENSIEVQHAFTVYERAAYLRKLYIIAIMSLLAAGISTVCSIMQYLQTEHIEYFFQTIINAFAVGLAVLDIIWSTRYPEHLVIEPDEEDDRYIDQSQTISYIHTCLSQCCLAAQIADIYNIVQFNAQLPAMWLLVLQFIIMGLLCFSVYVGYIYTSNAVGTKRLTVYVSIIICLTICALSAGALKQFILEVNIELYSISPYFCETTKYFLLILTIYLVIVALINQRRVKVLFTPISYLLMVIIVCCLIHNGIFVRQIQQQISYMNTDAGCRTTMSLISESSLKTLGCETKYLNSQYSPFLPCPKAQQSYMWENDVDKHPEDKMNTLACLNMNCCKEVIIHANNVTRALASLLNLLCAMAFVCACNSLMLSKRPFKIFQIRVYGDIFMIVFVTILVIIIAVVGYEYVPTQQYETQPIITQQEISLSASRVVVLPRPNYDKFQTYNPLKANYDFSSCQRVQDILLVPIDFENSSKDLRIAISGQNGEFVILNEFNHEQFQLLTSPEAIQQVFGDPQPKTDYVIFQGSLSAVQYFVYQSFYFCTYDLVNANFELSQSDYNDKSKSRLLAHHSPKIIEEQNLVQTTEKTYIQGDQDMNQIKFYTIEIYVIDLVTGDLMDGAHIEIFNGYYASSCSVLVEMSPPFLQNSTDSSGRGIIHNLNMGSLFTALITFDGYINACEQVDFTHFAFSQKLIKLKYVVNMSPKIPDHTMRLVLTWNTDVDFDLVGTYSVGDTQCVTRDITKPCGGMTVQQTVTRHQTSEFITVNVIQPYEYMFYVSRSLSQDEATKHIQNTTGVQNDDILISVPLLTVYVNEINYPIVQYQMPIMYKDIQNTLAYNWIVFCINGKVSDTPKAIQTFWSDISQDDIKQKKGDKQKSSPSAILCNQ